MNFQKFMLDQGHEKNYDMIDVTVDFLYSLLNLMKKTYFNIEKTKLSKQIRSIVHFLSLPKHQQVSYPYSLPHGVSESEAVIHKKTFSKYGVGERRRLARKIEANFHR